MTYEVTIKLLDAVEYKGIFSFSNEKIYIRSLIDEDEYESMFWQLIKKGYTKVEQDGMDFHITREEFDNNLVLIFEELQDNGIELTYSETDKAVFSLVADGDDLNPEVIAYLGTGTRFVQSAESIYRYINNVEYEPKIQIRAASYAVDIQDVKNDDDALVAFVEEINSEFVDIERYFQNSAYAKALQNLFDMVSVPTLKVLNIVVQGRAKPLVLSIEAIKNIKRDFKEELSRQSFSKIINAGESMRAFDDKKHKALLDETSVFHLHFHSDDLYNKTKKFYEQNKRIFIQGNYKSKFTIDVSSVILQQA